MSFIFPVGIIMLVDLPAATEKAPAAPEGTETSVPAPGNV